jgi:hypothetical protein
MGKQKPQVFETRADYEEALRTGTVGKYVIKAEQKKAPKAGDSKLNYVGHSDLTPAQREALEEKTAGMRLDELENLGNDIEPATKPVIVSVGDKPGVLSALAGWIGFTQKREPPAA